jgi:RNA polymerase sigma-70 factor (ECF subfamily)
MLTDERRRTAFVTVELEETIRAHCGRGEWKDAATLAVKAYGGELLGFLSAVLRDEAAAGDVFSQLCEDLWRGLPGFGWRSSLRTWAYTLARHAALRYLRAPERWRQQHVESEQIAQVAHQVRTETVQYLRSEVKDKIRRLRDSLEPDDQALLILRVDRGLPWDEVVEVMAGEDGPGTSADRSRRAAALRKRFERVKEQLKQLAKDQGLLGEE